MSFALRIDWVTIPSTSKSSHRKTLEYVTGLLKEKTHTLQHNISTKGVYIWGNLSFELKHQTAFPTTKQPTQYNDNSTGNTWSTLSS